MTLSVGLDHENSPGAHSSAATLELPWPPTANNLHAVVRGRKVLSRKGRDASEEAAGDA